MEYLDSHTTLIIAGLAGVAFVILLIVVYLRRRGGDEDFEEDENDEGVGMDVPALAAGNPGGPYMQTENIVGERMTYEKVILDMGFASSSKYWMKLSGGKILILSGSKVPLREIDLGEVYVIELVSDDEGYVITNLSRKSGDAVRIRTEKAKPNIVEMKDDEFPTEGEMEDRSDGSKEEVAEQAPKVIRRPAFRKQ